MSEQIVLTSPDKKSNVKVDSGELVSYLFDNEELIHQKGDPGWKNSDTEMFPIIGPTKTNKNIVNTKNGSCIQDQHGFLRELAYQEIEKKSNGVLLKKTYKAFTKIKNSKFPEKSNQPEVSWPFDFIFTKSFELHNDFLEIQFEITSTKGMPFMLGYHPTFKLSGNLEETILANNQTITIENIIQKGAQAYPFFNTNEIILNKKNGYSVNIKTQGFDNFMLWTEVHNMICIEPITQYPDLETQSYSEGNMRISNGEEMFRIVIKPC